MLTLRWKNIGVAGNVFASQLSRMARHWPVSWPGVGALLMGFLLAKWFWVLFAPATVYTVAAPEPAADARADKLFGQASQTGNTNQETSLPNVKLLGVFTASKGRAGFAILKIDERKQIGVAEGENVISGTRLSAVHSDYVLLERDGMQIKVNIEKKYTGDKKGGAPAYSAAPAVNQADSATDGNNTDVKERRHQLRRNDDKPASLPQPNQ